MDEMAQWGHTDITRFAMEYGVEGRADGTSRVDRANNLARYLIAHPGAENEYGENVTDAVVSAIVERSMRSSVRWDGYCFDLFQERFPGIHRGLARDGFTTADGTLRRALPENVDLPAADDEVHALLEQYGFNIPRRHLDQGITAHSRGDWEAANAQFRTYVESLFDSIAAHLADGAPLPAPGHQRRIWLANSAQPFFQAELNEWDGQGTGFLNGFFRRLHPAGAHPGLSDVDDSTFRLHLVLLVSRTLLRRL
ncbi:MAG TPA: hypothetical protein VK819_01310 [Acidobacteriaceae bacterium]|nr:hypothetical protein [Acidobacteriaceae bacterium]